MIVKVTLINLTNNKVYRETTVDWHNPTAKAWLDKTLSWAFHNKHGVQMLNIHDKEPEHEP